MTALTHSRLIKFSELLNRTALSRSEAFRRVRNDPNFPKPTKLGPRSTAFVEAEVDAYVHQCIARRTAEKRG